MKTKFFYSIRNCGDGSAALSWMESQKLVQWDQEHMDEGWGESCDGYIEVESDCPITTTENITTEVGYFLDLLLDEDRNAEKFYHDFFTEFPEFEIVKGEKSGKYHYLHFLQNGKEVYKHFTSDTLQDTLAQINKFKVVVTNAT